MDAQTLVVLLPIVGAQLVAVIHAVKGQRALADSVGSENGLGSVHDALHLINEKQDEQMSLLLALDGRVTALETGPGTE